MSDELQGKGFFGWLGRQVGHVKKAVQTDPAAQKIAYRKEKVEEMEHPEDPGLKLRRTTIDEVIVNKQLPRPESGSGGETSEDVGRRET